ncbi:MAG: YdeI/OmpD-associated family protein [Shimia sp.]
MIRDPGAYFARGCGRCERFDTAACSARRWAEGLATLRDVWRGASLSEHAKWGHPCYMHADRNVAIFGAFVDDFRLSFFDAALLQDPEGVLERQGPNTQHPDMIRFTENGGPAERRETIAAYLAEAKGHAERGIKPEKTGAEYDIPNELQSALDDDPDLAQAWAALTPGRRRG